MAYVGNRHYVDSQEALPYIDAANETAAYRFTSFNNYTVHTVAFYYQSPATGNTYDINVGIQHLTDGGTPSGTWIGDNYTTFSVTGGVAQSLQWDSVNDSTGWDLSSSSAYALVFEWDAGNGATTKDFYIYFSSPNTQVRVCDGQDDSNRTCFSSTTGTYSERDGSPIFGLCGRDSGENTQSEGNAYLDLYDSDDYDLIAGIFDKLYTRIDFHLDNSLFGKYVFCTGNCRVKRPSGKQSGYPEGYLRTHTTTGTATGYQIATNNELLSYGHDPESVQQYLGGNDSAVAISTSMYCSFYILAKNNFGYWRLQCVTIDTSDSMFDDMKNVSFNRGDWIYYKTEDQGSTWTRPSSSGTYYHPCFWFSGQVYLNGVIRDGDDNLIENASAISSDGEDVVTNSDGEYIIKILSTATNNDHYVNFRYSHMQMTPRYWYSTAVTNFSSLGTADSYVGDDEYWYGYKLQDHRGNYYAFRKRIDFDTSLGDLHTGCVYKQEFQTGYGVPIFTSADFNAGLQVGAAKNIHYDNGRTYFAIRNHSGQAIIKYYDHFEDRYSSAVNLGYINATPSGAGSFSTDTHYYPQVITDDNHYVYMFMSKHHVYSSDYNYWPTYKRSSAPGDIVNWSIWKYPTSFAESSLYGCSYLRVRKNPVTGNLFIFYRRMEDDDGAHNSSFVIQKYDVDNDLWYPQRQMAMFDHVDTGDGFGTGPKSIYCGGVEFDENGICYAVLCYLYNYNNTPQWEVCNKFIWSPNIEDSIPDWYTINGTALGTLAYWDEGGDVTTNIYGTAYPSGGTNEDYLQLLTHTTTINADGTDYSVRLPLVLLGETDSDEYPFFYTVYHWSTSDTEWKRINISSASGAYIDDPLTFGGHVLDDNNYSYVFGFVMPNVARDNFSDEGIHTEWTSNDYAYFKSSDNNWNSTTTFKLNIVRRNNDMGNGMSVTKNSYIDNYTIEGLYQYGKKVFYFQNKDYGYIRKDRNDLIVICSSSPIACCVEEVNTENSNVYFPIQGYIPKSTGQPQRYRYYIQYGYQGSAWFAESDPTEIWSFYDNFEHYTIDTSIVHVSTFRWSAYDEDELATPNIPIYNISSSSDSILTLGGANINKIASGWRACYFSDNITNTAFCATAMNSTTEAGANFDGWIRFADVDYKQFIGFYTSGHTIVGIGVGGGAACRTNIGQVRMFTGTTMKDCTYYDVASARVTQYANFAIKIGNGHTTNFYYDGTCVGTMTSTGLGGVNTAFFGCGDGSQEYFFDFMKISKREE